MIELLSDVVAYKLSSGEPTKMPYPVIAESKQNSIGDTIERCVHAARRAEEDTQGLMSAATVRVDELIEGSP